MNTDYPEWCLNPDNAHHVDGKSAICPLSCQPIFTNGVCGLSPAFYTRTQTSGQRLIPTMFLKVGKAGGTWLGSRPLGSHT